MVRNAKPVEDDAELAFVVRHRTDPGYSEALLPKLFELVVDQEGHVQGGKPFSARFAALTRP